MPYPLVTDRLSIRPLDLADLKDFVAYRQDPEVARFQSWDTGYSEAQAIDLISSQKGTVLPAPGDWLQLAVHRLDTGVLLGDVAVHTLTDHPGTFEIGFTLARANQGKGYAREAVARLIHFLRAEAGAKRVVATPDSRNFASINLLLGLGFVRRPNQDWSETFKGEEVRVLFFEKTWPTTEG